MKNVFYFVLIQSVFACQLTLAQPAGQKDMFPLSVGNCWTYLHQSEYADQLLDLAQFDTGSTAFTVTGSLALPDSTRWFIRQTRCITRHFYMSVRADSTIRDTLNFDIVELNRGLHPMYRLGSFETLWDSELPFLGNVPESAMVRRFYPADSSNAVLSSISLATDSVPRRPWAIFSFALKKDTGVVQEQLHYYYIGKVFSTNHLLVNATVTEAEEQAISVFPSQFTLFQNYPNPFNPTTSLQYALPYAAHVTLRIYDVLGREVITLVDEKRPQGSSTVRFDPVGLSSGVYFTMFHADGHVQIRKMVLVR